jgi:hypothetical protein
MWHTNLGRPYGATPVAIASEYLSPESGVKIESSALNRFQPMNLAQDAIGQIL